ncbi:MAG: ribbon-helix-helix protein, CopG family [bacterium]|jgi:hypothetical protein|nr:ribbon-helix-helix protein, CopG family [bacterium]
MTESKDDRRRDEHRRRALAEEHRGDVAEDSGAPVEPRRLDQMISVRLDPEIVRELRSIARSRNTTLSGVLREAAVQYTTSAHRVTELRWHLHGEPAVSQAQVWTGPSVSQSGLRLVSG